MLGFLKRNMETQSQHLKTKVYKALVSPHLEYCASVWDPQVAVQRVEMVQRQAARYVLRRYHNTNSSGGSRILRRGGAPGVLVACLPRFLGKF